MAHSFVSGRPLQTTLGSRVPVVRVRLVDSHHHVRACSVFVSNLLTGPVPRSFGSLSSLNVMYVRMRAVARVALHACGTRLGRIGCVSRCLLLAPPRAAHVTVRTPACPPCTYVCHVIWSRSRAQGHGG